MSSVKNRFETSLVSFLLLFSCTLAQSCFYTDTRCACSFGSSAGSCYEPSNVVDGVQLCSKRTCDPGWTCDCEGDYFCDQGLVDVYTLLDPNDFAQDSDIPCQTTPQRTVTSSGFKLGYFHPQFSDNGLLDQRCQVFAWWLDGVLQNNFVSPVEVTTANLAEVKASLSDWNNLPLRSGSVIAFRWKNDAYSCYNSISELNINGTVTDTTDTTAISHRFTYDYEQDWFATDYVEHSTWQDPIASNTGDNYGLENTLLTNTYWRIKIL